MKIDTVSAPRTLSLSIFRHNPCDPDSRPHMQTFTVEETDSMTLFILLNEIRELQDPSLQFDFVCRAGICGSCAMLVNGRPQLACRTLTQSLPDQFTLAPLPGFELIGDLSVNTGKWMRGLSERIESWVHSDDVVDLTQIEQPMEPKLAEQLYELERCIECGCCIAACATAQMREDFVAAVGLLNVVRFQLDPRDQRNPNTFYQVVGDENGVFGCMSLMGCDDFCPKHLPLAEQIAYLRRKLVVR